MKKLNLLVVVTVIFAATFFSSCASVNRAPENPAPGWATGPVLYEDGNQVFAVGKFQGRNISIARTAAETLAIKRIAMHLKQESVSNTQIVAFWRDEREGISYALVKYQK